MTELARFARSLILMYVSYYHSLLASERSERAQSCSCSIDISDTYVYIYICVCGRTSSYMRMLNSSLLGNEKLRGLVVHNVGGVKFRLLKHT